MIEEGLFSRFLKPLLDKKKDKDLIQSVLDMYIKNKYTFTVKGLQIKIQNISPIQKKEVLLHKEKIEEDLRIKLSKEFIICF